MLEILADREAVIAAMSALSVFSAVVVASWPYLARDPLAARMRQVATERERIRLRERKVLNGTGDSRLLHRESRNVISELVRKLDLVRLAADGATARNLRTAGYRGSGAVTTFVAARLGLILVGAAVAFLYSFVVIEATVVMALAATVGAAATGYYLPAVLLKNRIIKRQKDIARAWPDALDLLLISVESGMSIESAFRKVAEEIGTQSIGLAEELSITTAELSYLQDRQRAYENLADRTGIAPVRAMVLAMKQAEKHGTSLGQSLRVLAQESRDTRMAAAEKKAAGLPPKLTVPMILFFLPVLFAVITTPAAIQIINL